MFIYNVFLFFTFVFLVESKISIRYLNHIAKNLPLSDCIKVVSSCNGDGGDHDRDNCLELLIKWNDAIVNNEDTLIQQLHQLGHEKIASWLSTNTKKLLTNNRCMRKTLDYDYDEYPGRMFRPDVHLSPEMHYHGDGHNEVGWTIWDTAFVIILFSIVALAFYKLGWCVSIKNGLEYCWKKPDTMQDESMPLSRSSSELP